MELLEDIEPILSHLKDNEMEKVHKMTAEEFKEITLEVAN